MKLLILTALVAVCGAANLNRGYLPPSSADTAGGSPGALQTPFNQESNQGNQVNQGNQATQYNQGNQGNQAVQGAPSGAYNNEFQGVVVDADPGTRTNEFETGLGAPRPSYGSQNSKVGEAAFTAPVQQRFSQPQQQQFVPQQQQQFVPQQQQTFVPQQQQNFVSQPQQNFVPQQQQNFVPQQQSFAPQQQQSFAPQQSFNQQQQSFAPQQTFIPQQTFVPQPSVAPQQIQVRPNAEQDRRANIVRYENEIEAEKYRYSFQTDNGITAEQTGNTVNGNQAQGAFGYIGDDGENYEVTYTADERGFIPQGKHLPTSPPIPDIILKSIEQNARDEAAGIRDDGSYDAQRYNAGSEYNARPNVGSVNAQSSSSSSSSSQNNARPQQIVQEPVNNEFAQQQSFNNFGQQQVAQPSTPQSYLPPVEQYNQVRPARPTQQITTIPLSTAQPSAAPLEINIINRYTNRDAEVEPASQQVEPIQAFNVQEPVQQVVQPTVLPTIQYYNRPQQQSVNQVSQNRPAVQNNFVAQRPANNQVHSYNYNRPQQSFPAQNFQSPQGQVQYPRPAAAAPTIIPVQQTAVPQVQNQQNNGVTQAAASQFSAPAQSTQFNVRPQVQQAPQQFQAPSRPVVQQQIQEQPQINFSRPAVPNQFEQNRFQNFGQRQQVNQQFQAQPTQEPAGQQYNGEIYEYNKPAPVLSTPEPQISEPAPTQVPVQNQFSARPQNSQQFGQAPQFGQQQQSFVAQPQVNNQFAQQEESQNQNQNGAQNFGSQFQGAQQASSPLASQNYNENFGGARQPPSFNENTGYQY
ncbi:unnamed protein product [Plutella xylostella]|uniref:(diamondback moth) hypothetical protein n=1 Tax=Plutella xylostella TaxID=51655 RepID=A0A8S4FJH4_PLUXY|nr:unnamed protein product [Plutella xylostella]